MNLDIRLPIGALFVAIGAILAGGGVAGGAATASPAAPGLDVDLIWGAALASFGLVMLALAALARKR
jgi:hypothetical protein